MSVADCHSHMTSRTSLYLEEGSQKEKAIKKRKGQNGSLIWPLPPGWYPSVKSQFVQFQGSPVAVQ